MPVFATAEEAGEFWDTHDSEAFVGWRRVRAPSSVAEPLPAELVDQAGRVVERRLYHPGGETSTREYTILLYHDEESGGFTVKVPALPGCTAAGRTRTEALVNAQEAMTRHLKALTERGEPLPEEPAPPEVARVAVPVP